jgi:tRNA (uracil-5-)-methyltransferase TRM9
MNVQDVYNNISSDFSHTRYSVWHGVKKFLDTLPVESTLGDIGCGNGKNMLYRSDLICKGIDFSEHLIEICKSKNLDVLYGNILSIPFRNEEFDNTICIAVIHHLESEYERVEAIRELLRVTKKGGRILISVWALDQEKNSKRIFNTNNSYVPFHTKDGNVYNRFYHVYSKGEIEHDLRYITDYNFETEDIFYEKGNWYVILHKY